jgi:hypothetical protein
MAIEIGKLNQSSASTLPKAPKKVRPEEEKVVNVKL